LLSAVPEQNESGIGSRFFLATEIGCCGYFDEERTASTWPKRYFVDGACDPAQGDAVKVVPIGLLRELGVFLLPAPPNLGQDTYL